MYNPTTLLFVVSGFVDNVHHPGDHVIMAHCAVFGHVSYGCKYNTAQYSKYCSLLVIYTQMSMLIPRRFVAGCDVSSPSESRIRE
jgi:hypothetical protein